jgi:ribonuclease D
MGPGRVVPDRALVAAAAALPTSKGALAGLSAFTGRYSRKELDRWWAAIARGTTTDDLPPMRLRGNGLSTPRNWKDKHPEAYARFVCVRAALAELSAELTIPVENLILPDTIRRICFTPPADISVDSIASWLRDVGTREWQVDLIPARLNDCFERVALDPTPFLTAPAAEDGERQGGRADSEG